MCQSAFLNNIIHLHICQRYYWRFTCTTNCRPKATIRSKCKSKKGILIQCCFTNYSKIPVYKSQHLHTASSQEWVLNGCFAILKDTLTSLSPHRSSSYPALVMVTHIITTLIPPHSVGNFSPCFILRKKKKRVNKFRFQKLGNLLHETTQLKWEALWFKPRPICDQSPHQPNLAMSQPLCHPSLSIHHFSC